MPIRALLLTVACFAAISDRAQADAVHVLAAGSLREAVTAIDDRYREATGAEVSAEFGPSGLLRTRIEQGEHVDLFALADMSQPMRLQREGRAVRVVMFTRNALCAMAVAKVGLTAANLIDRLLDPTVRLGTSTPKDDPAGDYTWAMFHRIDALRPGSYKILDNKAQQIVGGPANSAPVAGKSPVVATLTAGRVDIFIGYCSGARLTQSQIPGLQFVDVPRQIANRPEFGLAVLKGADPRAADFALFMLSPEGQQIFARYGFAPVALPASDR